MITRESSNKRYLYVEGTAHVHLTVDLKDSTVTGFMLGNRDIVITQINKESPVHIVYRTKDFSNIKTIEQ